MPIEQYTYWSVTINNPEENDYLIMRNPNSKYVRALVWTPEVGAEGTEHIQAWVRLQRNQSLAFVKKLYPRSHLKHCDKDAYNENCYQYAQKNDETTAGNHHIELNDPLPAVDSILYKVLDKAWDDMLESNKDLAERSVADKGIYDVIQAITLKRLYTDSVEREMIMERSGLEKIFVSPAYEKMKTKYWREILYRLKHNKDASTEGDEASHSSKSGRSEVYSDHEESKSTSDEGSSESSGDHSDEEDA